MFHQLRQSGCYLITRSLFDFPPRPLRPLPWNPFGRIHSQAVADRGLADSALAALVRLLQERGFSLLDVQFATPHLLQFGAIEIPHALYSCLLRSAVSTAPKTFTAETAEVAEIKPSSI